MAIGKSIVSAFAGPADPTSFDMITHKLETKNRKIEITPKVQKQRDLYKEVREIRENNSVTEEKLVSIFNTVQQEYADEWLLLVELYELAFKEDFEIQSQIKSRSEERRVGKECSYREEAVQY